MLASRTLLMTAALALLLSTATATAPDVSEAPSKSPSDAPSSNPSESPSNSPSDAPSRNPSESPSRNPSESPSTSPSDAPSKSPSDAPSRTPSLSPSGGPSGNPSESPSGNPASKPSGAPTKTAEPTTVLRPSMNPSATPSNAPTTVQRPSSNPSRNVDITYTNSLTFGANGPILPSNINACTQLVENIRTGSEVQAKTAAGLQGTVNCQINTATVTTTSGPFMNITTTTQLNPPCSLATRKLNAGGRNAPASATTLDCVCKQYFNTQDTADNSNAELNLFQGQRQAFNSAMNLASFQTITETPANRALSS